MEVQMKNEYEIRGDVTAIFLNKKDGTILETLISTKDLALVQSFPYKWHLSWDKHIKTYYVKSYIPKSDGKGKTTIRLHCFLFQNPKGMVIDHINHDTLNNTRANLRAITSAQNHQNRKGPQINSTSNVRGVHFQTQKNKWRSVIRHQGKLIHLGLFSDIRDAEYAVIEARKRYMPYSTN